jgi:mono/diheme cytochrome c family protein
MFKSAIAVVSLFTLVLGAPVVAADKAPAAKKGVDVELAKKGAEVFKNNCVVCHGESLKGDGVAAAPMNPKPRNLLSEVSKGKEKINGWKMDATRAAMLVTVEKGLAGTAMAPFGYIGPDNVKAVVEYVLMKREEALKAKK